MDPTACLRRFLDALNDGDDDEARQAYEDLTSWLAGGGFPPNWTDEQRQAYENFEY